ncbi:hypothetical protein [Mesorhizobium sp.]|uniref:hypothetical protein n=1 Tax=Mesorhizobium sp. TaxID=1871066 RepID=UPI000FE995F3|nr:hypothetical protein [Mesorhizobium sp.]RWE96462.1 MAG: hypothetical protein EOS43_22435 [Mesorhizobium sp.]
MVKRFSDASSAASCIKLHKHFVEKPVIKVCALRAVASDSIGLWAAAVVAKVKLFDDLLDYAPQVLGARPLFSLEGKVQRREVLLKF